MYNPGMIKLGIVLCVLAHVASGQSTWQIHKSCTFEDRKDAPPCDVANDSAGMIAHAAMVCDTPVKLTAVAIEVRLADKREGLHGIPLTNVGSQVAGDIKLVSKSKGVVRFRLLDWHAPTKKFTCVVTAILTPLK